MTAELFLLYISLKQNIPYSTRPKSYLIGFKPVVKIKDSSLDIRCFSQASNKQGRKYWCANHTSMKPQKWKTLKRISFLIVQYHRGIKQHFLVGKSDKRYTHPSSIHLYLLAFFRKRAKCSTTKTNQFDGNLDMKNAH